MKFDVVVVGGGHAGTEAAAAATRRGARVALVTFDRRTLGAMSCNPAIGGIGKGHLVREVDAFDGLIGRAADAAAIHYRMLNRSKGLAVRGPRVQADRVRYAAAIQATLRGIDLLTIVEGEAAELLSQTGSVTGVMLGDGRLLHAPAVILATGTFLGGRIFRGEERLEGGRIDERAATRLGQQLQDLGLPIARLKTGTPPRLDGRTIDWSALPEQPSDAEHWTMSPMTRRRMLPQVSCAVTRTTRHTHDIIRGGLDRSPLFSGAIEGAGPRYCPSIEDKVYRFGDRDGHQIFLEPEGLDTNLIYPNGISTSLPTTVQASMIATIPGLAEARIVTPGYAVEYDHIDPRALTGALMVRDLPGLFCAGQINGTTGYEEAAGQGLVAGANASAFALDVEPLTLDRATSYLGVMVDDLVLQGVSEPYRMLTARAEHRLRLRTDNAETRLGETAYNLNLLSAERLLHLERRAAERARVEEQLAQMRTSSEIIEAGGSVANDGARRTLREWCRFDVPAEILLSGETSLDAGIVAEAVEDARYAPYLDRQMAEVEEVQKSGALPIPQDLKFHEVCGLSNEMVERLSAAQPETIGAAGRIRGISPAAVTAILLHVKRAA